MCKQIVQQRSPEDTCSTIAQKKKKKKDGNVYIRLVKLSDVNNHIKRFPVPGKTIYHLFYVVANELLESYKLRLLLLLGGTLIDDNEHIKN